MFFFSVFANSSENCECNLLIIHHSDGSGYHHFTKQSEKIEGQPVYASLSGDVIWWSDEEKHWAVHTDEKIGGLSAIRNIKKEDLICDLNEKEFKIIWPQEDNTVFISTKCLKRNDHC